MSRNVRIMLALVMLTLFLGSGAAHALPSEGRNADRSPGMLVAVWEWMSSLLEGKVPFLHETEALGGPAQPAPPPDPEGGGSMDPNG